MPGTPREGPRHRYLVRATWIAGGRIVTRAVKVRCRSEMHAADAACRTLQLGVDPSSIGAIGPQVYEGRDESGRPVTLEILA